MRKVRASWTSEPSEDQATETGSRLDLLERTRKKKNKKRRQSQSKESPGKDNQTPKTRESFARLRRSAHVRSTTDSTESGPRTIDVVADVHGHQESSASVSTAFTGRNVLQERSNGQFSTRTSQELKGAESVDSVEEEFPVEGGPVDDLERLVSDEIPRTRRQWDVPGRAEDRKPRKRWSKDTSVIRLPETKESGSSNSSVENVSPVTEEDRKRPVPVPRATLKKRPHPGLDNAAFVEEEEEDEEVLRIETDHNTRSTRIELRRARGLDKNSDDPDRLTVDNRGSLSLKEAEIESDEAEIETEGPRNFPKGDTMINAETSDGSETGSIEEGARQGSTGRSRSSSVEGTETSSKKIRESRRGRKIRGKDREQTGSSSEEDSSGTCTRSRSRSAHLGTPSTSRRRSRSEEELTRKRERRKPRASSSRVPDSNLEEDLEPNRTKKKKKKKKTKKKRKEEEEDEQEKKDVKYISVTIHRADLLEPDYVTKHPMVKVHVVEAESGRYLRTQDPEEPGNGYLQPVITGKFDFRENRSMIPVWEEELILRHDYDALLRTDQEQVVVLFEVVDLLPFSEASSNYDRFGKEGCWYKVAWAFLRPVGRDNSLHTEKKVRLQLYRPRRNSRKFEGHRCEVYTWWKSGSRDKYPSSLFVTIGPVVPPRLEPVVYQQLTLIDSQDAGSSRKSSTRVQEPVAPSKWTRLAAQSCKIPNESYLVTEASENGCFFLAFSNDGKFLACALSEEYDYPIVVYEVETKKIHVRFSGHKTFVYSLNWSQNDHQLLSVSSDQTARIWDVRNQIVQHVETMPHPSYVYCGRFEPEAGSGAIVATGCYDRVARIWAKGRKSKCRELSQELEGHEGFVNCLCFQRNGTLVTGDSVGAIVLWTVKRDRRMPSRKEWHIARRIKVREIDGVTINTILLHPLESRLIVHSRNNGLRMLDLASGVVLQKYPRLNNQRIQSTACVSPCGGLILCGGEDSSLNVWSLETGKHLARYELERGLRAVTCVDYHPYGHMLAFSTFGSPSPVRVLRYEKEATGEDIGLRIMEEEEARGRSGGDVSVTLLDNGSSLPSTGRSRSSSRKRTLEERFNTRPRRPVEPEIVQTFPTEERATTKLKLQRLGETGQSLKTRSASRLYSIIERIDRILSNNSRSSEDVETGAEPAQFNGGKGRRGSEVQDRVRLEREEGEGRRSRKSTPTVSCIEDRSGSYFESSTPSEAFELIEFCGTGAARTRVKRRSKSAKELRAAGRLEDDLSRTLSDSAANPRNFPGQDESVTMPRTRIEGAPSPRQENFRTSIVGKNGASSCSSTGTYVVEKAELERNADDGPSRRAGDIFSEMERGSASESLSIRSNATFVLETKVPVPRPRRRNAQ